MNLNLHSRYGSNHHVYHKLLLVMKLIVIILTTAIMQVSASSFAQKITLNKTKAPLGQIINEIRAQSGYDFLYNNKLLKNTNPVTINVKDASIEDVLAICFKDQPLTYKVEDKAVWLREREKLFFDKVVDRSNIIDVRGKVVDATSGEGLEGANVKVKGLDHATSTDKDGNFSLQAVNEDAVLEISFIGYITKILKARRDVGLIRLEMATSDLQEVTINKGYYTERKNLSTGSVATLSAKEIAKQSVSNPLLSLQGRMPGVYIQQNTGMPGGGIRIQIRGQNSLRDGSDGGTNGNLPLYLIDGVPFSSSSLNSPAISGSISGGNPLSVINPNDIENIEVLKDGDATAIYGSRGANGVVLITTKRAKAGKARFDLNMYQGVSQVSHFLDLLNTSDYLTMRREGFKNDGILPNQSNAPDLMLWDTTRYTNWQKELIGGTAKITNANMTFSGGSATTQFSLSAGYYREGTVFPGTNMFHRSNGRLFINHRSVDNRLTIEASANYAISESDIPSTDFTSLAISLVPVAPELYDSNGNLNWENGTWTNPLAVLKRKYHNSTDNLIANTTIGYEVIKNLRIKSGFGYTSTTVDELGTNPVSSFDPQYAATQEGYSNFGDGKVRTWIIEPMADYNVSLGKGVLTALVGGTMQHSTQNNQSIEAYGYSNDALLENLGAATTILISSNSASVYKYAAAFARLNYNWNEKYIINLTGRRDGSSRFGPGNRFANFGAVGAAWIFSNESFLQEISFLSFGKLRTSYGFTGSDAIDNYQYLEAYSTTLYPYGGSSGLALTRLANPNYSWETNRKAEVGLDLKFLQSRLSLSASYYNNRSSGQLVGLPLPVMTGQSSVQFNLPAIVQNSGLEFLVSSVNVKSNKFEWATTFNLTIPQNKLVAFPKLDQFPAYASRYDVGNSVYTYKGYEFNGVNPKTGTYEVVDRNQDGQLSSEMDYVGLKRNTQIFFGGLGNNFKFANFELDLFFQFVKQNGISYRQSFPFPGGLSNQPDEVMNRWRQEGDVATNQRFASVDPTSQALLGYYYATASDNNIQDASFIRLKNASLSWKMPSDWFGKAIIKDGHVFIQGQNIVTFTNYIGLDPEIQTSFTLPPLRTISVGVNLSL